MQDMTNAESTTKTIVIRGREYSVTTQTTKYDARQYILTGKRGATYGTMRNKNNPDMMFLFSGGRSRLCSLGEVWLTDKGGELQLVRA